MPNSYSYAGYKRRLEKYGGINTYDMSTTIMLQQKKIEELERRVSSLEGK